MVLKYPDRKIFKPAPQTILRSIAMGGKSAANKSVMKEGGPSPFSVKNARETRSETEEGMNHSRSMGRNHPFQFSHPPRASSMSMPLAQGGPIGFDLEDMNVFL